jgi:hypothetical protein
LWETHTQIEELRTFRDELVQSWRGVRWAIHPAGIALKGSWTDPELRWVLEAAFRAAGWPREAERLHGLARWALPILLGRSRKSKTWGGWQLDHEPSGWVLHPMWRESSLSQVRLGEGETPREVT